MNNKEAYYFSHDCNARNDDKIIAVRMRHGMEGYGIYFAILERLRENKNYMSVCDYNIIAYDLRVDAQKVKSIIEDFELFKKTEDGKYFYSESFNRRMSQKDEKSKKLSEAGKRGNQARWNKQEVSPPDSQAIATQSQEKEIKEKEIKINIPPISPQGGKEEEKSFIEKYPPPDNKVKRNYKRLVERLEELKCPQNEMHRIVIYSNYGEIENPVWRLLDEVRDNKKLVAPVYFILKRLSQT